MRTTLLLASVRIWGHWNPDHDQKQPLIGNPVVSEMACLCQQSGSESGPQGRVTKRKTRRATIAAQPSASTDLVPSPSHRFAD
jgi:hypothetical protein